MNESRSLRGLCVAVLFASGIIGCSSRTDAPREDLLKQAGSVAPATTTVPLASATSSASPPAATPSTSTASSGSCAAVILQATASRWHAGYDDTNTAASVAFQIPATIEVVSGNTPESEVTFEYGPSASESAETECRYRSEHGALQLEECHSRQHHHKGPKAGDSAIGTHFELHVGTESRGGLTVHLDLGATPLSDFNPCTADKCGAHGGASHTPMSAGTQCGPSNGCATPTCDALAKCVSGAPIPVDDGNPCTSDSCSVATGVVHTPVAAGTQCGAGDACTSASTCDALAKCVSGAPIPVDDGNACTADSCSVATGVVHTPVAAGTQCGPGDACSGASTCNAAGACVAGVPAVVDDNNRCTVDSCSAASGVTHTPAALGTVCGGNACVGLSTCDASATCQAGAPPKLTDGDACTIDSCDPATGVSHIPIPGCGVALVPPALDPSVEYDFLTASSFLFSGPGAVQTGVQAGAIVPARQVVIRGRALDTSSVPVRGLRVSARGHDELGVTYTRDDGKFDFVANGGMNLVLELRADDFIPVSRLVTPTYHTFTTLDDIVVTARDSRVTAVDLGAPQFQVVRGSTSTDADGTRTATILIPPNTTTADLPAGAIHVRATEFTVGPNGKAAMPGVLPPASGYTYAVELSVDEAEAMGLESVRFNQPLSLYVDNFIHFPVGEPVPLGYYDRSQGTWVASTSGRVISILNTLGGIAHVDVTGDGVEDTGAALDALGISLEELQQLAVTYAGASATTLWRVQTSHFTAWDANWPTPVGAGITGCDEGCSVSGENLTSHETNACGSIIDCHNASLGESWSIPGTGLSVRYTSVYQGGHRTLNLTLGKAPLPPLKRIDVFIDVAGQLQKFKVPVSKALDPFSYTWDAGASCCSQTAPNS